MKSENILNTYCMNWLKKLFGLIHPPKVKELRHMEDSELVERYREIEHSAVLKEYLELKKIVESDEFVQKKYNWTTTDYRMTPTHETAARYKELLNNSDLQSYLEIEGSKRLNDFLNFKASDDYVKLQDSKAVKESAVLKRMYDFEHSDDYQLYLMFVNSGLPDEFKTLTDNDDAITYYEKYTTGDTDFSEHLKALKKSKVKSVLLPGEMIDASNIIKQASEMGLDVTFLGTTNWGSTEFLKAITTDADGQPIYTVDPQKLAFVQFFAVDGDDDTAVISKAREAFLKAYHKKYGNTDEPEEAVALGYDAYGIAIDAVLRAENGSQLPDGEAIRDQLLSKGYEFEGASGTIRFNKKGDPKKTAYISTWEDGIIKAIYTIEADEQ